MSVVLPILNIIQTKTSTNELCYKPNILKYNKRRIFYLLSNKIVLTIDRIFHQEAGKRQDGSWSMG